MHRLRGSSAAPSTAQTPQCAETHARHAGARVAGEALAGGAAAALHIQRAARADKALAVRQQPPAHSRRCRSGPCWALAGGCKDHRRGYAHLPCTVLLQAPSPSRPCCCASKRGMSLQAHSPGGHRYTCQTKSTRDAREELSRTAATASWCRCSRCFAAVHCHQPLCSTVPAEEAAAPPHGTWWQLACAPPGPRALGAPLAGPRAVRVNSQGSIVSRGSSAVHQGVPSSRRAAQTIPVCTLGGSPLLQPLPLSCVQDEAAGILDRQLSCRHQHRHATSRRAGKLSCAGRNLRLRPKAEL